jgi:hypothetical protein
MLIPMAAYLTFTDAANTPNLRLCVREPAAGLRVVKNSLHIAVSRGLGI